MELLVISNIKKNKVFEMDKKKRQDLSKSPTFVGFFVIGMMGRFNSGIKVKTILQYKIETHSLISRSICMRDKIGEV